MDEVEPPVDVVAGAEAVEEGLDDSAGLEHGGVHGGEPSGRPTVGRMLSTVEDQLAVAAVMHRYARTVDNHDFPSLRTCFTDRCTLAGYPPPAPEVVEGGDAIVEYISGQLGKYGRTQHLLGQIEVTVDGDTAYAESYVQAFHLLADDDTTMVHLWGSYHDWFVRAGEAWVIDKHRIDIVHVERRHTPGRT